MSDDLEITLLELIGEGIAKLDVKARERIIRWMSSWHIDDARKQLSSLAPRVAAFAIVTGILEHLRSDEREALVDSIRELVPATTTIRPSPPRAWSPHAPPPRRRARARHCSLCHSTEHDKRTCDKRPATAAVERGA